MLIAFVITVSRAMSFRARAMAVVVVPESSSTDSPSSTRRAAVGALYDALAVEEFQVFADGDLRNAEMPGQVFDEHTSIAVQDLKDFTAAFFVEQTVRRHQVSLCFE